MTWDTCLVDHFPAENQWTQNSSFFLLQKLLFPLPACFSILQLEAACKLSGLTVINMERIQCKLTPCFRLSLAWSATSDTITKAATTQTKSRGGGRKKREGKRDKIKRRVIYTRLNVGESTTSSVFLSARLRTSLVESHSSIPLPYLVCPRILWNQGRGCSDSLQT